MPSPKTEATGTASATLDKPLGHLCVDDASGCSFVVGKGQAILDAALAQGVELPHGCRVGTCGACAVEVLRGADHLDAPDTLEALSLKRFGMKPCERLACRATTRGALRVRPLD